MSSAKLGNQVMPPRGNQDRQAPEWESGEACRQVGVQAAPVSTDQVGQDDIEEWCHPQHEEQQLDNLLDDKSIQEDKITERMEGTRSQARGLKWQNNTLSTLREPEYRPHDSY